MPLTRYQIFKDARLEWYEFKQVRFPRSKKKRIRNKWAKNKANWENKLISHCVKNGNLIYVGPLAYERLLNSIES